MLQKLSLYCKIFIAAGTLGFITYAVSQEMRSAAGYRDTLLEYIETHSSPGAVEIITDKKSPLVPPRKAAGSPLTYVNGDWEKYIIIPRYRLMVESLEAEKFGIEEKDETDLISYGSSKLNMDYGKSRFTSSRYKQFDTDTPVSRVIKNGYNQSNEMQLHMEGRVGERLTLYIDHDSRKKDNHYLMQYRAVRDDEVIREINAGEIDIKMNKSKYAVYDDTSSKGLGIDTTVRKGKLQVKAFGSVTRGETVVEYFKGNSSAGNVTINDYQYVRNTYFQLEAFRRYDNRSTPPTITDDPYNKLIAFTSSPLAPESYVPYTVNIDSSGFELYMDDQNALNNFSAIQLGLDGGYYTKMVSGTDYTINYTTGLITFLKTVPVNARIFAVYTLNNGGTASTDPSARTDVASFTGKVFVFIKYGYSLNEDANQNFVLDAGEDKNGDGKLNLDIYEVRSFYYLGDKQILQDNLKIKFYNKNQLLTKTNISSLGKYSLDYSTGVINFNLREPFKQLLSAGLDPVIYTENQSSLVSEQTQFNIRVSYYKEARSFQLKHFNIIPDSVRIKINERELASSLYSVDYTSGFLVFTNAANPVITSETSIEVKYEYLPFMSQSQSFIGGVRADYELSRDLNLGGTFLYTRTSGGDVIPTIGNEPSQTMVFEGDAALKLNEKRLKDMVNAIPGVAVDAVPLELKGYAEYARSIKKVNTFGKALIDDMESSEEITGISLSDKDWQLSSMPYNDAFSARVAQSVRGKLFYKYYRNPSNPEHLKGTSFSPYAIDYSKKPGPYNVATGHVADSIQPLETQRSLVFDYEFTAGQTHVPAVTRRLSSQAVDFSGLQYVEIWYRADASNTGNVNLYVDIGEIDEDSDGNGTRGTEDSNNNGFLDYDPSAGIAEDRGYLFNGNNLTYIGAGPQLNNSTLGDGVLNTEDLNGNGTLDTTESIVRLPGSITLTPSKLPVITPADTAWQKERIYIDRTSTAFSSSEELLKQVESVRLFIESAGAGSGKIYVDSIRFVSSRWRNIKIGPLSTMVSDEDPNQLKVTMVDSINDSEYRANGFLFARKDVYESIHGDKTDKELAREQETALQLEYSLPANIAGSVTRKFSKAMDIRFYKTLNVWIDARSSTPGDRIRIRVGSSENDYYEYDFANDYGSIWREVALNLKSKSGNGISRSAVAGNPDAKRIDYMEFIIYNNTGNAATGKLWVDDIYVSDPDTLSDSAYWYEAEIKGTKPLFHTAKGVPVISDIYVKYVEKGHGSQFSTVGKTASDISEKYRELFSSVSILPNWKARLDFILEKSSTDSFNKDVVDAKRGKSETKSFYLESDYVSAESGVPSVKVMYKDVAYENSRNDYVSTYGVVQRTESSTRNPALILREYLDDVLWGKITTLLSMDMTFKDENIKRKSPELSPTLLEQYLSLNEKEKRQKGTTRLSVDYQSRHLFIQPAVDVASHEIVELKGKQDLSDTEILGDVGGGYHFPFLNENDIKYVERNKKTSLAFGLRNLSVVDPAVRAEFYYYENKFRDYEESERLLSERYSRAKDARSFFSNTFTLPFNFASEKKLRFIKNLSLSYMRSVYFQETDIPYEGEGTSAFNEHYGINRAYQVVSDAGLDLYHYSPWYFFMGRGNYANGRDYVYSHLNEKLCFPGGTTVPDYSNILRAIDNYSLNTTMDLEKAVLNLSSGLNQVVERQIVNGIPQQVITLNTAADINFDLMQIFSFGFFRPNRIGQPYHSSNLNIGYDFRRNMIITSNVEEDAHAPHVGLTFKWDRSSIGTKAGIDYRHRTRKEYISFDDNERDSRDDIYISNMQKSSPFKDVDRGYNFAVLYETDVQWIYSLFSSYYKLIAFPIFSLEYSILLNRYNYTSTASPEPYDQHLVSGKLTLDLHKNVQGSLIARWALERWRNRETNGVNREIMSYEIGVNFSLIF